MNGYVRVIFVLVKIGVVYFILYNYSDSDKILRFVLVLSDVVSEV